MQSALRFRERRIAEHLAFILMILPGLEGCCNLLEMDYVPGAGQIRETLPELVAGGGGVEGLYANHDVDCLIFRYKLPRAEKDSPKAFLEALETSAGKKGWSVTGKGDEHLRLLRKGKRGAAFSIEEARVAVIPEKGKVYVAWVQGDEPKEAARMEEASEGEWAARHLWPKLEEYINDEKKGK